MNFWIMLRFAISEALLSCSSFFYPYVHDRHARRLRVGDRVKFIDLDGLDGSRVGSEFVIARIMRDGQIGAADWTDGIPAYHVMLVDSEPT